MLLILDGSWLLFCVECVVTLLDEPGLVLCVDRVLLILDGPRLLCCVECVVTLLDEIGLVLCVDRVLLILDGPELLFCGDNRLLPDRISEYVVTIRTN